MLSQTAGESRMSRWSRGTLLGRCWSPAAMMTLSSCGWMMAMSGSASKPYQVHPRFAKLGLTYRWLPDGSPNGAAAEVGVAAMQCPVSQDQMAWI